MSNEIIVTEEIAIIKFKENTLDTYLKTVEKDALNFVGSTETKKGRDEIISKAASVTKIKTTIEKAKKKLTESQRAFITNVNAEGKKSFEFLADLSTKVRQPVTDYEKEQEEIEQARRDQAEFDIAFDEAVAMNDLFDREREVKRKEDEQKAKEDARIAKEQVEAEEKAQVEYEAKVLRDADERAERKIQDQKDERLNKAGKARQEILLEIGIRLSFEDCRRMEESVWVEFYDNQNKIYQAEQNEIFIKKLKTEAAEKLAEKVRLKKIEDEKAKAIADKKASHHAHIKKFNREALECFKKHGYNEEAGIKIIKLIAKNEISHITMNY